MSEEKKSSPFAFLGKIFEFIEPSSSPFFSIVLVGCIGIAYLNEKLRGPAWYVSAIAIVCTLGVVVWLTGRSVSKADKEPEWSEAFRFSTAVGLSFALGCLAYFGRGYGNLMTEFVVNTMVSLAQVAAFVWSAMKYQQKQLEISNAHYAQIALVTSVLLGSGSYYLSRWHGEPSFAEAGLPNQMINPWLLSSICALVLWCMALRGWLLLLRRKTLV